MSELPGRAAFEGALNQGFVAGPFLGADGKPFPLELKLVEVLPLRQGSHPDSFSLRFQGPRTPRLQQGLYPFQHPGLGALEIFLTPIARGDASTDYEAIFNRG